MKYTREAYSLTEAELGADNPDGDCPCWIQDFRQLLGVTPVEALKALRNVSGLV